MIVNQLCYTRQAHMWLETIPMWDKLTQQTCHRYHHSTIKAIFFSFSFFQHRDVFHSKYRPIVPLNITTGTSTGGLKDVIQPEQSSEPVILEDPSPFSQVLLSETENKWFDTQYSVSL